MLESWPTRVVDTNILFDARDGGILPDLFRLPVHWIAPDVIMAENLDPDEAATWQGLGLRSVTLTDRQVLNVMALTTRYRRPSIGDLAALVLAQSRGLMLLTGDSHLRAVAESEGVMVHGTLWLLDEMVAAAALRPARAADALEQMLRLGRRLPSQESVERIKTWRGG